MSLVIIRIYSFECDRPACDFTEEAGGPHIGDARAELRRAGWTFGKLDLCPEHARKRIAH